MVIRVELMLEEGCVGVAVVNPENTDFVSTERFVKAAAGRTIIELNVLSPRPGISLVIRNSAKEGIASRLTVYDLRSYIPASSPVRARGESSFVPLEELVLAKSAASAVLPLPE
jgi:hypothetical protein